MRITSIQLVNFRNYTRSALEPCPSVTVLYGDNAQGKTALLESVVLCCTGRSHRTSRDRELVRWDQPMGRVTVSALREDGAHTVDITLRQDARKTVSVNGKTLSRTGELMGHVSGVLFAPEDLRMVKGGPEERRRFLDMAISQMRPAYYYALQSYQRALLQRNRLLRDIAADPKRRDTLPEWDGILAKHGEVVMRHRAEFIARLSDAARESHGEISGGLEDLRAAYEASAEGGILSALQSSREEDIRRGTTCVGPHRDDILVSLDGRDVRIYGSQGQQRTAALSMKLAELEILGSEMGEPPVLMLDDVMSELDPHRRRQLLSRLRGIQTIVTCTDLSDLADADIGAAWRVREGTLLPEGGDGV